MNTDKIVRDLSLLATRVTIGASIAAHGAQKMYGAFDGPGIEGVSQHFGSLGFDPPEQYARAASTTEMVSGALIALGALGPVGPGMLLSVMIAAVELVHRPKGYWSQNGGYEMNVMYALVALLLATEGYGSISVDALLGLHKRIGPAFGWLGLAGGVAAALAILSQRDTSKPQQPPAQAEKGETEAPATVS